MFNRTPLKLPKIPDLSSKLSPEKKPVKLIEQKMQNEI